MKVKLLETEKDDVRKERDAIKDQLSKLIVDWDMKAKQLRVKHRKLEREKDIVNEQLSKLTAAYNDDISKVINLSQQKEDIICELKNQVSLVTGEMINQKKHYMKVLGLLLMLGLAGLLLLA